jgi:NTP pyrophosphatase (non-canonical NTP hydrolase)
MNLEQYTQDALRTESRFDSFDVNPKLILGLLNAFIGIGNMMDQVKKNACYGSDFKQPKMDSAQMQLNAGLALLGQVDLLALNGYPKSELDIDPRVAHGLVGIMTEASELAEAMLAGLENKEIDAINIQEETIDINWYQAILHDALDLNWEEGLDRNIQKLKTRYPEKFTQEAAENRNLTVERANLEGK